MTKNILLSIILFVSISAHAEVNLMEQDLVTGLTPERMNSPYFEKWNLKLGQAVQFVVAQDLAMGSVKVAVNHEYYFYRDVRCEVTARNMVRPITVKKGTRFALVDYMFSNKDEMSIIVYARDSSTNPTALDINCKDLRMSSKVKDLQQALQKVFVLEAGKRGFFGLF